MGANISTNLIRYAVDTPIQISWNYTSPYNFRGGTNYDTVAIVYNDTILNDNNEREVVQMLLRVSTLTQNDFNETIRDVGSVTLDGNLPDEAFNQAWPLQIGHYKAYLYDSDVSNFAIYATSDTFTVFTPFLLSNKPSYDYNESITLSWEYTSFTTGTIFQNVDFIGIFDSTTTIADIDVENPNAIFFLWVSTLESELVSNHNSTTRNSGTVTLDSQPPNETYTQSWPLQGGKSYKAMLIRWGSQISVYVESDTFVVRQPPTIPPTIAPTMAPADTTTSPSIAPIRKKKQLFCNVFILKDIFCSDRCGFIGRLLKKCRKK